MTNCPRAPGAAPVLWCASIRIIYPARAYRVQGRLIKEMEEVAAAPQPSLKELVARELRLDPRQWEEGPPRLSEETPAALRSVHSLLEINCLVSQPLK